MNHTKTFTSLENCTGQHIMKNIIPCGDIDCGLTLDKMRVVLQEVMRPSRIIWKQKPVSQHAVIILWRKMFFLFGRVFCQNIYSFPKRCKKHGNKTKKMMSVAFNKNEGLHMFYVF